MAEVIDVYKSLFRGTDIIDVYCKYLTLFRFGMSLDFGYSIIPKGTELYRIRRYDETIDFSNKKEWDPNPKRTQNRLNRNGEQALYLGSNELVCLVETNIQKNEQYVLGRYITTSDIKLACFTDVAPTESKWKFYAGIVLNSFLIAPSRSDNNTELFSLLDSKFEKYIIFDINIPFIVSKENIWLPFIIATTNKKDRYYEITNDLAKALKYRYSKGIGYSSCYFPLETCGIESNCFNVVLYESGLNNIQFVDCEIKKQDKENMQLSVVKSITEKS